MKAIPKGEIFIMKKLLIFTLVILTAAAFVGCELPKEAETQQAEATRLPLSELDFTPNPRDYGELEDPLVLKTPEVDPIYLPDFSEVVKLASGGSEVGSYYLVVTDAAELQRLTGDLNGKTKNTFDAEVFQRDFVVAVFVTVRSGGFTFEVERASNDGNTLTVNVKVTPPAAGTVTTQALETHCVLVAFDRGDFYEDLSYDITVNGEPVSLNGAAA